jgi:hypothetical protein
MSVLYVPPCPTTCSGELSEVSFDACRGVFHWGEISKIYLADSDFSSVDNAGNPGFSDVTSLVEWNDNLSDTADGGIRTFIVLGDLPEAESTETPAAGDLVAIGYKTFTLNFQVDQTNDTNYTFLLMSECGGKYLMWFETRDGLLFGGNLGLTVSLKLNYLIPREKTALQLIMGKATWESLQSPFRCASPLA